jgi:3-hydroxyisobutyrate dehydrogenase
MESRVKSSTVALVGYGKMGRAMGRRLLSAGCRLTVFDLDPVARRRAAEDQAAVAASPLHAAAAAEVIITMLPGPGATRVAAHGDRGIVAGLRPDALWIEMSSSHPGTTRQLADAARSRRAFLLDAPVSGGVAGAESGTLTIMVGGAAELLERARPVLDLLGENVFHVGDQPGDGDLAKTINNLLSAANLTVAAEALTLGSRGGLDPARLLAAVGAGSGGSHALTFKFPKYVLTGAFDAGFSIGQMLKDIGISQEMATEIEVPSPVGTLIHTIWDSFAADGHGDEDHTAVAALIASQAGVDIITDRR